MPSLIMEASVDASNASPSSAIALSEPPQHSRGTIWVRLLRIAFAVGAAVGLATVASLIAASPAAADGDDRLPSLKVRNGGVRCEVAGPPVGLTYDIQNTSRSRTPLDYRLSFPGRPDIQEVTGLIASEAFPTVFYDGGLLTAALDTDGRIVGTIMWGATCEGIEAVAEPVRIRQFCAESQKVVNVRVARDRVLDAEPVIVAIGAETFVFPAGENSPEFVRTQASVPRERIAVTQGEDLLLDVEDVPFACEQQASDIDVAVSAECRDAVVPGAVVVTVTNHRKVPADVRVDVAPSSVAPLLFGLFEGQTQTRPRTGRPNGTYTVTSRIGAVTIDEQTVEVACATSAPTAEIDWYCVDGNGVIAATVTGADTRDSRVILTVSGLAPRIADVAAGETAVLRRTGRPDGRYSVAVFESPRRLAVAAVEIACDPPPPLVVEVSSDCESTRIVARLTNTTNAPIAYEIDIVGVEIGPLTGTVDADTTVTRVRTGRRDGIYTVLTSADGVLIATQRVQVLCFARSSARGGLNSYCFAGDGVIAATLVGGGSDESTFVFRVEGLADRILQVPPGETQITRRTGRPDGVYDVSLDVDGFRIHGRITIACDEV